MPGSGSPVGTADPERPEVLVLHLRADVLDDLDHAHVARMRQDAGQGEPLGGVRLGVVERVRPPTVIWSGTVYGLIGVWPPRSSAAAAVITLAVLPGGNTADTGRSWVAARLVTCVGW